MNDSSRRRFLSAGLGLPAAAAARPYLPPPQGAARPQAPVLRYRTLGKTGLKVTEVGFGCMITSDASVIQRAAGLGITYFDTARGYQNGNNERMVGAALKGKRKGLVLSSKTHAGSKQEALANLDTSLKELGTDYLDVWYLHAKTRPDEVTEELLEAQQEARKAGKIRFAGVSTHSGQKELIPALAQNPRIDVILTAYNFSMSQELDAALAQAAAAGKGIVAMKVMAGGFRRARPGDKTYDTLKRDGAMLSALKWAIRNPNIHTTVPSMTDMDQLDENLNAMAAPYGAADAKLLAAQLRYIAPLYCRMCGECDGVCPNGVPVQDVLRFLAYAEGYGQFALGRERFRELPRAVADVRCGDCPSCTVECPHGVKVAERLIRAQELFA